MIGYGNAGWGMMGGAGIFGPLVGIVVLVDLILLGIWLWQKVSKK
jgi:hypothetical protein